MNVYVIPFENAPLLCRCGRTDNGLVLAVRQTSFTGTVQVRSVERVTPYQAALQFAIVLYIAADDSNCMLRGTFVFAKLNIELFLCV